MTRSTDLNQPPPLSRRTFCSATAAALTSGLLPTVTFGAESQEDFRFNYLLASAMYGKQKLGDLLPEVRKTGATAIDIWRLKHANQREQIAEMGFDACAAQLKEHNVRIAATTIWGGNYVPELDFVKHFGGNLLVTGFVPESTTRQAAVAFVNQHRPGIDKAASLGINIAFENHGASPDDMRRFADAIRKVPGVGIAFAPYHLPQDTEILGSLIKDLGQTIKLFYAWQHGMGCMKKLPKEQELLQMPGRGDLDFAPLVDALKSINYSGWTEIFMHPVPRGVPILETTAAVTAEINRARDYLENPPKNH